MGRGMRRVRDVRLVEARDQQPGLVIDGEAERARHPPQALAAEHREGGLEQGGGHRVVVDALEQAELPGRVAELGEMGGVADRRDPPDRTTVPLGHEQDDRVVAQSRRCRAEQGVVERCGGLDPASVAGLARTSRGPERPEVGRDADLAVRDAGRHGSVGGRHFSRWRMALVSPTRPSSSATASTVRRICSG